jgi:polyphosphate kinase 2
MGGSPGTAVHDRHEALFSLNHDRLPKEIADAAFTSGHYPYDRELKGETYRRELRSLQIELLKFQDWVRTTRRRVIVFFEGRDAAGKGGTIKHLSEHLNPRHAYVEALSRPTETEQGEWYFQRYIRVLPTAGDMTLFDRSWYNRAVVERVMGFCSEAQVEQFYRQVNDVERLLVDDGAIFVKIWLTIGREEQLRRFYERKLDPLKRWKLSEVDLAAVGKWHEYSAARDEMLARTHTPHAPWTVIMANDKRRARLNAIRCVLADHPYAERDDGAVGEIDRRIVLHGHDPVS